MGTVKYLHVVGFKNSGKTTLMTNWIHLLKKQSYTVSAIKHHGHGATLAMPDDQKDSMRYLHSGVDSSIVAGGGHTQHIMNAEMDFESLKSLANEMNPDIVLIEGYKQESGPKVVFVRNEEEWKELSLLSDIVLIIGPIVQTKYDQISSREKVGALNNWLLQWFGH